MALNGYIRDGDNPDLTAERRTGTFPTNQMSRILWTDEVYERFRKFKDLILTNPQLLSAKTPAFATYVEKIEDSYRKEYELSKIIEEKDISFEDANTVRHLMHHVYGQPIGLHTGMFIPAISNLGTDEQAAKWLPPAKNFAIFGTYAQTELGHALETTADFDREKDEFVIHSPTTTSLKWSDKSSKLNLSKVAWQPR